MERNAATLTLVEKLPGPMLLLAYLHSLKKKENVSPSGKYSALWYTSIYSKNVPPFLYQRYVNFLKCFQMLAGESCYCFTLSANKVQTFHKCKCLRRILRGYIGMQDRNRLMDYISILSLGRRGWRWIGHRQMKDGTARYTMDWKPQSARE